MVFDGNASVHRVQYYPYDMLELASYNIAGVGLTKLRAGFLFHSNCLTHRNDSCISLATSYPANRTAWMHSLWG